MTQNQLDSHGAIFFVQGGNSEFNERENNGNRFKY